MVAVTLHELRYVILPECRPVHTPASILGEPLVIELVDHKQSVFIA